MFSAQYAEASSSLNKIEVDKFAHAGISYVIADQLHKSAGMNRFWASATTIAIGALKEANDKDWNGKDFAADCIGAMFWQVTGKF